MLLGILRKNVRTMEKDRDESALLQEMLQKPFDQMILQMNQKGIYAFKPVNSRNSQLSKRKKITTMGEYYLCKAKLRLYHCMRLAVVIIFT